MPKEGSTSNEKLKKTPWSTKLNSWLVQRFVDLKSLFTERPTTGSTISPLTPDTGRSYLGNTSNRLARQVLDRTSSSLLTFRAADLPLISGVSHFTLSRLASSPTVWQQALSLPWIRQHRRQGIGSSRTQYESVDWQPIESDVQSSQDFRVTQHIQQHPAGTELPLDSDEANTDKVISKGSHPLVKNAPLVLPITKKEALSDDESTRYNSVTTSSSQGKKAAGRRSLGNITKATSINQNAQLVSSSDETYPAIINTYLLPSVSSRRLDRVADELPYNTRTPSLPLITEKIKTQQQVRETRERTSKIPYIYRSEASNRTTDESQKDENIYYRQIEDTQESPAQVNQQHQNRYLNQLLSKLSTSVTQRHLIQPSSEMSTSITQRHLTQPSPDVLKPVTQRVLVRRSSLESRPYEVGKNKSESEVSPLRRDTEQKHDQPEIESSSIDTRQVSMPVASSIASQPTDESSIGAGHILPLMLTYEQSGTSQNKALPDQKLNLVTPVLADKISRRFNQSQLQKTAVGLDSSVSHPASTQETTSIKGSGVFQSKQTPQPVSKAGQSSMRDPVASRLQQQALEKARGTKTPVNEVKKSPRRAVIQRTIIEPDSAERNVKPTEEVISDKGSGDLTPKQTPQSAPKAGQSSVEEPITDSLQQQESGEVKVIYTPVNEVIKSPDRFEVQRTAVEPDSEATNVTLPQKVSQSNSSRELQYRVEQRSKSEIGPTQKREPTTERVFSRPEMLNLDTGTAGGINRDLVGGYTEKVLSYRQPLSLTSQVTRPITVIRNVSGTMDMPSQQLFRTTVSRHVYNKGEDHDFLQGGGYRTALSDYRYTNQPPMAMPVTSSVRPKTESGFTLNEKLFRYTSDTIPELPYSWTHNSGNHSSIELALAPVSRVPETNNIVQKAEEEPKESGGEAVETKEPSLDLKALAREVYPYLRRMIMAERDRQPI